MKCMVEGCDWEVPDADGGFQRGLDHIRVMHPDQYGDGPERWPDGEIVFHDMTWEDADDLDTPDDEGLDTFWEPPC